MITHISTFIGVLVSSFLLLSRCLLFAILEPASLIFHISCSTSLFVFFRQILFVILHIVSYVLVMNHQPFFLIVRSFFLLPAELFFRISLRFVFNRVCQVRFIMESSVNSLPNIFFLHLQFSSAKRKAYNEALVDSWSEKLKISV